MSTPSLWSVHPFLPVIRRSVVADCQQLGVLYDAVGVSGRYGYTATVWLTNLFLIPKTEAEFFERPKIVYDTFEELVEDGWVVD